MGPSPAERAQQKEWQAFADANRWKFDAARMKLEGERAGTAMEVALETDGQEIHTAVTARFPGEVHVAFTARPTRTPGFLQGIFGQDIKVGDPEFDLLYNVTGVPADAVRAALARPRLLAVLKELGNRTMDVQLNHRQLFFRHPGPCSLAAEIEWLVHMSCTASHELFAEVRGIRPFS